MEEEIFEFKFIPGFRTNSNLLYIEAQEQIFAFKYKKMNTAYYYCYNKNCNVGVAIDFNSTMYCRLCGKNKVHNHGSQIEIIKKLKIMNSVKCEVRKAPLKRSNVREIFDEQCKKFKDAAHTINYGNMRRQLFKIRQDKMPKNPNDVVDIIDNFKNEEILKEFGMSRYEKDKSFYLDSVITNDFSYTLFVSPTISKSIKSLSSSEPRNYIMDATFNVLPRSKTLKQLLIIHFIHADHVFPFIYALMSNKTEEAYLHMFQYIKSNVFDLRPTTIITDYENALRNANKIIYPTVKMVGCWFHYTNALRRKASKITGFIQHLNRYKNAKNFFNKFLYLPLLKASDIEAAYQCLKTDITNDESGKKFQQFFKYYEFYWLKKEKVTNFSVYKEPYRTSNGAENFHSQLNMKLRKHGNFYKFVDALCEIDAAKSCDFLKSISGCTSLYTKKKLTIENRDTFLKKTYDLLKENKISFQTALAQFSNIKNCKLEADFINSIDSNDDESDADEQIETEALYQNYLQCVICCDRERQLMFQPCKHFKVCKTCYDTMKEDAEVKKIKPLCPVCRSVIIDAVYIFRKRIILSLLIIFW